MFKKTGTQIGKKLCFLIANTGFFNFPIGIV